MTNSFVEIKPNIALPYLEMGVDLDQPKLNERQRVMVVDDEPDTVFLLKQILRLAGFNVLSAGNGEEALNKLATVKPDLVLLDLMMPDMDGWETFRQLRAVMNVPVIIVSALGSKEDVVSGLENGVDDYIAKPFFNAEVTARVKSVLRRAGESKETSKFIFPSADLTVDLLNQEVTYCEQKIHLSQKEFAVLAVLAKHTPAIVDYETISMSVWGEDSEDVRNRTKYLIYLLRRTFDEVNPEQQLILNVDRLGYRLDTGK
jgi:two-component system, OmpR family, KDP operon response regulator KdpE